MTGKLSDGYERLDLAGLAKIRVLRIRNNADDLVSPSGILRLRTHLDLDPKR